MDPARRARGAGPGRAVGAKAIDAGGSFGVAKVTFDRAGIRSDGLRAKQTMAWSEVEEVRLDRGQVVISSIGPGKPITVALEERNAMVAARLVGLGARLFG